MSEQRDRDGAIEEMGEQVKAAVGEKRETTVGAGGKDVYELYQVLLGRIWGLSAAAIGAPGAADLANDSNPFLRELVRRFEPEEFFVDDAPLAIVANSQPLRGTMHDIVLRATMDVGRMMNRPEELQAYYRTVIATSIDRMLRENIGTPENHVDLVLLPLTNNRVRVSHGSPSLELFVATLWAHLDRQPENLKLGGWVSTAGILAEYLRFASDEKCLLQSSFYFHRLLSFCVEKLGDGTLSTDGDLERLRGVAANLANILEGIRRLRGMPEDSTALVRARQALKRVTAATVVTGDNFSEEERWIGKRSLEVFFGIEAAPWWTAVIDDMMNSTTAWNEPTQPYRLLLLEVAAGIVRSGGRRRLGNAPSAFFNAGVSLTRLRTRTSASREVFDCVRALVNAVGFFFAVKSSDDPRHVLITNDGLDCCRNMIDACSDLSWRPEQIDTMKRIVSGVYAFKAAVPAETEFFQLRTAINSLGVALPDDVGRPSLDGLPIMIEELIAIISAKLGIEVDANDGEPLRSAGLIGQAIRQVLSEVDFSASVHDVSTLVVTVSSLGENPRERVPAYFRQNLSTSPVVSAGLLEAEKWPLIAARAIIEPSQPLGAFLRADESTRWMSELR